MSAALWIVLPYKHSFGWSILVGLDQSRQWPWWIGPILCSVVPTSSIMIIFSMEKSHHCFSIWCERSWVFTIILLSYGCYCSGTKPLPQSLSRNRQSLSWGSPTPWSRHSSSTTRSLSSGYTTPSHWTFRWWPWRSLDVPSLITQTPFTLHARYVETLESTEILDLRAGAIYHNPY
jgi:hypothetical protein